jgi:predicted outer membrane repeat protein
MVNNNSTTAYGGGIYCSDSQPTITGCTFESNLAGNNANGVGGGIYFTYSDPIINTCFFIDNSAGNINFGDGGGINCLESNLIVQNCIFEGNNAQGFGGGIFCDLNCELIITNCNFSNNTADLDGGGMRCYSSQVSLSHCLINSNTSGVCGGGIKSNNSNLDIHNCTLSGNGANNSGGGIYCDSIEIKNTIIEGNSGNGGIFFESNLNSEVHHNDFFNNQNGNFSGNPPANLGQIVTVNANGDSCDTHFNIFLDPLYYSLTGDSAYYLTANSPCIDAGDPGTPYDPDGTIADLGAFYFDQGTTSPLTVGLIPLNPPIQIPPGGGEFQFNISIGNSGTIPITFDAWTNVTLPDGNLYPLLMRPNLNLLPGGSLSRTVLQSVPAGAPTGIYSYNAYVGTYPTIIADSSSFPFQKLPE